MGRFHQINQQSKRQQQILHPDRIFRATSIWSATEEVERQRSLTCELKNRMIKEQSTSFFGCVDFLNTYIYLQVTHNFWLVHIHIQTLALSVCINT